MTLYYAPPESRRPQHTRRPRKPRTVGLIIAVSAFMFLCLPGVAFMAYGVTGAVQAVHATPQPTPGPSFVQPVKRVAKILATPHVAKLKPTEHVAQPSATPHVPAGKAPDSFTCADGTISHAAHRQGACSHHGGIKS